MNYHHSGHDPPSDGDSIEAVNIAATAIADRYVPNSVVEYSGLSGSLYYQVATTDAAVATA